MAIGYLQHRGCLPNLQADVNVSIPDVPDDTSDPDVVWVGWGKEQGVKAHVGFSKSPTLDWTSAEPDLTVGDAIRGFFSYFSRSAVPLSQPYDYTTSTISILNGGVMPRAHAVGDETRADTLKRNEMVQQGLDVQLINQDTARARQLRLESEAYMGKGDKGIQPRSWGDRKLVVQDPFLWQKVKRLRQSFSGYR